MIMNIRRLDQDRVLPFSSLSPWSKIAECIMSHLTRQTPSSAILALIGMMFMACAATGQLVEGTSGQNRAITLRTKESSLGKPPFLAASEHKASSPDFMHVAYPI